MHIKEDDGNMVLPQNHYMHKDALGSVDTITDESGRVVQRLAYKPFGERIKQNWINETSAQEFITKRGYTGHEHIEEFNFIHMNGRVYDPTIGRFLSADPNIQAPYDTASYNRYTYVKNNPLKYTDPSGFFFKKIFKAIKSVFKAIAKYIKVIIVVIVAAVIVYFTAGAAAAWVATWGPAFGSTASLFGVGTVAASVTGLGAVVSGAMVGALAGFVSGAIMTGTLKGALSGALFGAISGGIASGIGNALGHSSSFFEAVGKGNWGQAGAKAVLHGLSRGVITKAQGGKFSAGFWSGFITSGFSVGNKGYGGFESRTVIMALVGGATSEISGGKFANGAVSGAFVHMFNAEFKEIFRENNNLKSSWKKVNHIYGGGKVNVEATKVRIILSIDKPIGFLKYYTSVDYSCNNCIKPSEGVIIQNVGTYTSETFEIYVPNNQDKLNWYISVPPQRDVSFNGLESVVEIYVPK